MFQELSKAARGGKQGTVLPAVNHHGGAGLAQRWLVRRPDQAWILEVWKAPWALNLRGTASLVLARGQEPAEMPGTQGAQCISSVAKDNCKIKMSKWPIKCFQNM